MNKETTTRNAAQPSKLQGRGTQSDPFNAWAYEAIKTILKNPKASRADIVKELQKQGFKNANSIKDDHINEIVDRVLRRRIDMAPKRYIYGSGTCFLMVKLKEKSMGHYKAFQQDIKGVDGVIEWDHIPGRNADYLVRVVGKLGDPQMHVISDELSKRPNVKEVYAPPELTIAKSGVVDNFEPEDFLNFDLSDHPKPPTLHKWKEEAIIDDDEMDTAMTTALNAALEKDLRQGS